MSAARSTAEHGADVGGRCRCGFVPELSAGEEVEEVDEGTRIRLVLDALQRHYDTVGWSPPPIEPPPRDDEPRRVDLGATVERLAAISAARPPDPEPPAPSPDLIARREAERMKRRESVWTEQIPSRFLWARAGEFEGIEGSGRSGTLSVAETLVEWGRHPGGRNLVLAGATGVGKTHAAVAAARVAFEAGAHVEFVPVVELLDALRPSAVRDREPTVVEDLVAVDVLVLDDLGAERPTDWTLERLYSLVNRRWMEELSTIATTNLELPGPLRDAVGERTYSRLVGNDAVVVKLGGPDRRRS